MDPKRKKRPPAKVVKRIAEMKADRRRDLFKGALGLGAALLLVAAKTALELWGLVSAENVAFVNLLLLMAMGYRQESCALFRQPHKPAVRCGYPSSRVTSR